jgi:lipoprotein NlpD
MLWQKAIVLFLILLLTGCTVFSTQEAAPVVDAGRAKTMGSLPKYSQKGLMSKASKPKRAPLPHANTTMNQSDWMWPTNGKVIKSYQSRGIGLKGIALAGKLGAPVKAAASGKVVYSGQGLRGYGQLIIIKHNNTYLSAYGHNSQLLVKEGQMVSKGEIIAKMGQSGTDKVKLHFEIRKNGSPIDPLTLLPARAA